ncbi:S8 family peptidase [Deinococcus radiophilus]|uniref:Peptidase S8 and S53 subtilisin kexin sedolisin n=1 Tax=Deinococcus radiophilus TaxID=32062 RepID=A0A3S0I672_9DEIO|nr:S8 family serine peptidase [Deinococcus radiophilus]RTR26116.1 peptidase S8 and S53 subtilisin kexin sedolisin [Deinococcus radiophilus]UFA51595.1 S8 family serine peptidase [Deinococcus radiophilus]
MNRKTIRLRHTASFALAGLLTLSACGGGTASTPSTPSNPTPAPQKVTISGTVHLPAGTLSLAGTEADWSAPHVPGELLVASDPDTLSAQGLGSEEGIGSLLAGLTTEPLGELGLLRVQTPDPQALADALAERGLASQPNYIYEVQAAPTPNDPGYPGNAGVRVGGAAQHQTYLTQIQAMEGWKILDANGKNRTGAKVAVLDTGADRNHPDLKSRIVGGYDYCSTLIGGTCSGQDSDFAEINNHPRGHGTAMLGLVGAATHNSVGLSAVTWAGPLLAVKVFGDQQGGNGSAATTASLARGIDYSVAQKARVINVSLGIPGLVSDPTVRAALDRAAAADIVVVSAAGNTSGDGIYFPANQPDVLAVGAVNSQGVMSCFSARPKSGQTLNMLAPGGDLSSCGGRDDRILELDVGSGYKLSAGTSEASALVSGAASLIRNAYPGLNAAQVRQALISGGKAAGSYKQLNLPGAVNAAKALTSAPAPTPTPKPKYYDLTVQAYQDSRAVGTPFTKSAQLLSSLEIPYRLNLPAGTYTLKATVDTDLRSYLGQVDVTATSDKAVNIPVEAQ